jgi:prepilin-type N-terminal cleavage/methylation domain-containing protein
MRTNEYTRVIEVKGLSDSVEAGVQPLLHPVRKNGFTLIELMIVVTIISILAMMAIPRFMRASVKAKQSEAKLNLKQIYTMENAYRQEKDTYFPSDGSTVVAHAGEAFIPLAVEIMFPAYYSYSITGDATSFVATAGSKNANGLDDDPTSDVWTINQNGNLICITDDSND